MERRVGTERSYRQSGSVFQVPDAVVAEHVAHGDGFTHGIAPDDECSVLLVDHGPGGLEDHRCIAYFERLGRVSVAGDTVFCIVERDDRFLTLDCHRGECRVAVFRTGFAIGFSQRPIR